MSKGIHERRFLRLNPELSRCGMYSDVKLQREGNTRTGPKTLILSFF